VFGSSSPALPPWGGFDVSIHWLAWRRQQIMSGSANCGAGSVAVEVGEHLQVKLVGGLRASRRV
jgi:hypothetical protein